MTWYYNNITPIKNILAAFFMGKKIETTVFRIWGMLLHLHKLVNKILIVKLWFYKNSKHKNVGVVVQILQKFYPSNPLNDGKLGSRFEPNS